MVAAACSGMAEPTDTTSPTVILSTATPTPDPTTTVSVATTPAIDAPALFDQSLAATSPNYRFHSLVQVGEVPLTDIRGSVDGESVAADVTTGTSTISYVRTPEGEWVTGPDEEWAGLDGEPPAGAPLDGLAGAGSIELVGTDGDRVFLSAVLGEAAGPASGIPVTVTVVGGLIARVEYQLQSGPDLATVTTDISEVGSAGSIASPV